MSDQTFGHPMPRGQIEMLASVPYENPGVLPAGPRRRFLYASGLIEKDPTTKGKHTRWRCTAEGEGIVQTYRMRGWLRDERVEIDHGYTLAMRDVKAHVRALLDDAERYEPARLVGLKKALGLVESLHRQRGKR